MFRAFVDIGEDIVIDHRLTSNVNLRDYYEAAMDKLFQGRRPPHLNNILEIWIEYALAHNDLILAEVPAVLKSAMSGLVALTDQLQEPMDRLTGTRRRAELYSATWSDIRELVMHPPELPDDGLNDGGGRPEDSPDGEPQYKNSRTMPGPTDRHDPNPKEHADDLPLMNASSRAHRPEAGRGHRRGYGLGYRGYYQAGLQGL